MESMCTRLKDMDEAGVYRLNCTLDELRTAAEQTNYTLFEADLAEMQGKGEFLAAVAQGIYAPGWFGNNWDALADALADLSWRPATGYVLLLSNGGEVLGLGSADHQTATEILSSTVTYWKSQGKPFWVFLADDL